MRQYTDALGGNWCAVVLNSPPANRVAFISYYKGEYSIRTLERKEPLHTAMTSDFGAPGPVVDFQSPLQHTLVKDNERKKAPFEKMFLEGRPPVNVGVTSNGYVFGGTQVSFGDVLGDQQFNVFVASIQQYRQFAGSYVNLSHRFQYALQGFSQTTFFYGQGAFINPALASFVTPADAIATRTIQGGSLFGIYPLDRYRRLELSASIYRLDEEYSDPTLQATELQYQIQQFGQPLLRNGTVIPFGGAFVQETTIFREFGPLSGDTMRLAYDVAPPIAGSLSRQTFDLDYRHYFRIGGSGLFATRIRGFRSSGDSPDFIYFGGNSELRGYNYLQFAGSRDVFADVELRFPLIEAALTPIGIVGGVRGVFFAGIGGAWFQNQPSPDPCNGNVLNAPGGNFTFATSKPEICQPITGTQVDLASGLPLTDANGNPLLQYGPPRVISGFRLKDGRASYGLGLETFVLGFPIHFDWSWRTLFNSAWEDVVFSGLNGCSSSVPGQCSSQFRAPQFAVWIGYDF
jgi:hypothetical protein